MWLLENIHVGKSLSIIAWIHSHVQNMHCCYSSVDVHMQYAQQMVYTGCFGIVVEIKNNSEIGKFDAYVLTDLGLATVWDCNDQHREFPKSRIQHPSCHGQSLYKSIWSSLSFSARSLQVMNFVRNTTTLNHNLANLKAVPNQPITQNSPARVSQKNSGLIDKDKPKAASVDEGKLLKNLLKNQHFMYEILSAMDVDVCKGCKRKMPNSSLLRHISQAKKCKAIYGDEYDSLRKTRVSNRNKNYKSQNAAHQY